MLKRKPDFEIKQNGQQTKIKRGSNIPDMIRVVGEENNVQGLCPRCQSINFRSIYQLNPAHIKSDGYPIFNLGQLNANNIDLSCNLCVMFNAMARHDGNNHVDGVTGKWHLRAFPPRSVHSVIENKKLSGKQNSVVIVLVGCPIGSTINSKLRSDSFNRGLILSTSMGEAEQYFCRGQHIPEMKINYDWLNQSINSCSKGHKKCQRDLGKYPSNARVIDCKTRQIVPLKQDMDYFTLSYVWGGHDDDLDPKISTQHLPQTLPQTVEDAIQVTLKLGRAYLWVDRYCIDQFHNQDKVHQIAEMANIYEHGLANLVALGPDSTWGLEGVSRPMPSQYSANTKDGLIIWSGPSLQWHLFNSNWNQRGWTYQEGVLSQQCIFFTGNDIFVACQTGIECQSILQPDLEFIEDICLGKQPHLEPELFSAGRLSISRQTMSRTPDPLFCRHLREYTSRDLSYDYDIINGFRGILSRIGWKSYWGIPAITESKLSPKGWKHPLNIGFICGMLWISESTSSREARTGFPSWSWTSVKGRVRQHPVTHTERMNKMLSAECVIWAPQVSLVLPDSLQLSVQDFLLSYHTGDVVPEQSSILSIRSVRCPWKTYQRNSQTDEKSNPEWLTMSLPGLLVEIVVPKTFPRGNIVGSLHLDRPIFNGDDTILEMGDDCLQEGYAILLGVWASPNSGYRGGGSWWLAVKEDLTGCKRLGLIYSYWKFDIGFQQHDFKEFHLI